ncbi:hypothetical protein [Anabaena catenula]|uniref:Uncharacterized protein n=1 Tax=Anabaena catenula FACHB-362 TaxID=2692877 RepID=A0ABR8IYC5_9NOST|nr:hypothetical protein [Anabaena catenula]MBD2690584.1 hypothetical protein [Anabaena catenula FACHB-362]
MLSATTLTSQALYAQTANASPKTQDSTEETLVAQNYSTEFSLVNETQEQVISCPAN